MNKTGVAPWILHLILKTCLNFSKVNKVILYGSRARGDYQQGSDIDIAIDAPHMESKEFSKLWNQLDDLPIIYTMDIVHLQSIQNPSFLKAINKDGVNLALFCTHNTQPKRDT